MKFKKGDKAVMVNCGEGEHYAGKIWTCRGDSFKDNNKEEVVFLEGFSGYFHCRFLVKPYKDENSKPTSESPFYEVLDQWGEDLIEQEKDLLEVFESVILGRSFTLKNGIQVKVQIGRDIIEED